MKTKCAPSCQTCEMIDMKSRCPPLGDDVRPALLPGELNAMFERILAVAPGNRTDDEQYEIPDGLTNYTVHVHSRPGPFVPISRESDLDSPPWVRESEYPSVFSRARIFRGFYSRQDTSHVPIFSYFLRR